ncbi:hypothetical protein [Roseibium sediminicola]|uniref:Peptidase inhibitor I78 family protein n=1 Tax=Roseibium sediminicola TaxID=2933272 RepID=A0ABT0GRP0_9HYPH|nr:hypothetical protein [Roseibium sp. CAU 1639]MCK7611895.1 hypothetical protein [Roseibium sp. CAU 1639]
MTRSHSKGNWKLGIGCATAAGLLLIGGCNTSSSNAGASQTVRTSEETAPTDLQLLCASKTVEKLQISGGNALPVSSARSGEQAYQVNLTFEGGQATCIIDESGVVQSITPV